MSSQFIPGRRLRSIEFPLDEILRCKIFSFQLEAHFEQVKHAILLDLEDEGINDINEFHVRYHVYQFTLICELLSTIKILQNGRTNYLNC